MQDKMDDSPPRSGPVGLTERALDELGAQCQIPADLEDRILASVVSSEQLVSPEQSAEDFPVIPVESEPSPLRNVIRLTREDSRRQTWIGRLALLAAAALVVTMLLAPQGGPPSRARLGSSDFLTEPTSVQMRGAPPLGIHGTEIPESHPRLVEAKAALVVVAKRIEQACNADTWSTVVRFENTGYPTVLDVESSEPRAIGCVESAVMRVTVAPNRGRRLAVRYERLASITRIAGWLLDET